jgi:hypothetical protein
MRYLSFLLILCSGTFVACGDPAGPETGGIALRIRSAEGHQARAEQGQVHVRGPTNTTVSIQRGETRTRWQPHRSSYSPLAFLPQRKSGISR